MKSATTIFIRDKRGNQYVVPPRTIDELIRRQLLKPYQRADGLAIVRAVKRFAETVGALIVDAQQ